MMKERILQFYVFVALSLLVSLVGWGMPVQGQTLDSLKPSVDSASTALNGTENWRTFIKRKNAALDSFKRAETWRKDIADTLTLNNALAFLQAQKTEIQQFQDQVTQSGIGGSAITVSASTDSASTDSASEVELSVNDSSSRVRALKDTLAAINGEVDRLLTDIDYLYKSTIKLKEESSIIHDSTQNARNFQVRMVKVMQKNLIKDGADIPVFDVPSWSSRFFVLLVCLFYFYWTLRLGKNGLERSTEFTVHKNQPLYVPIFKGIILFLILLPFTSTLIPVWAFELSYLLIYLLLYVLLYQELTPFKRRTLNIVFVYYFAAILANLFLSDIWWIRLAAAVANVGGIMLLWSIGRRIDVDNPIGYLSKYIRWALLACNVIALVLNGLEYLNISRMWSLVAAIGLLQALSLRAFRDMVLHDLENQYTKAKATSWLKRLDRRKLMRSVDLLIGFWCTILILIVLLSTLHLNREAWGWVDRMLDRPLQIAALKFSFGDLLTAIFVLWVANWFQKNLGELLKEPTATGGSSNVALLPIFRLIVVVVALLSCFSLVGLGMDKLTVIIGALSVGIGLGLQNVVNNFVSGIILIFEKPFKYGDYVELADKKGQVVQIGIRSSTLLTDQGARVIIPNGDLLSGRLVNWTFSESDIRLNMQLSVGASVDIESWRDWLESKIRSFKEVDTSIPLKIWTKDVTADNYVISLQIGIKHVRYIEQFRSKFLEEVKRESKEREISVASS